MVFFALKNIIQANYFSYYFRPHTMLYQTLVVCLILYLFVEVPPGKLTEIDWLLLLLMGVVFTAIPHTLITSSLLHLSTTYAGLLSCLQPLYGSVLAFFLLHEYPDLLLVDY